MANNTRVIVFNVFACGTELANVGIDMNDNNHSSSSDLGVLVVLGIVPIVVYLMAVLLLPWVEKGLH